MLLAGSLWHKRAGVAMEVDQSAVQSIFYFNNLILVMMKFDKIEQMQRSWDRFWNSFLRILTKIVRNVFRILNSRWIQILCSVIYYLAVIITAFLLTRDRQEDSFIKTEMKVSQLEKNLVEALIVILFFCI